MTTPDGVCASYRYDAFGRRIGKTVDGHTTQFFWQGDHLVAESSKTHYRSYVYEPGSFRPLAMLDGKGPGKTRAFHYQLDHLGTPQELTDCGGEIVWSAKYSAYGKLAGLAQGGGEKLDQPLRFQGQYFDAESGLHYNRHRYYQPDLGRYLTPDPEKLAGGLNSYQYTRNPTGWVDPLGLSGNCPGANTPGCKAPDDTSDVKVDEGEVSLPYSETQSDYLYRGDLRRPEIIFETGFESRGESKDLALHVADNRNPPSNFVSTSTDLEIGIDFGTKYRTTKGFVYTIRRIEGYDVNKVLRPNDILYDYEDEIAIPYRINTEDIIGVTPLRPDGSFVGYSIPNPRRQ